MSIYLCAQMNLLHKRLKEERLRLEINQDDFAEIGGVRRRAQSNYESGDRCPDGHYYEAISAIGVDVQYILTGVRSLNPPAPRSQNVSTHQLYLVKSATEVVASLKLSGYQSADLQNIIYSVAKGNRHAVAEAMSNYANSELTKAEKDLIAAYRKAAQPDKAFMARLAHFAIKAAQDETESGESVNIEGKTHEKK